MQVNLNLNREKAEDGIEFRCTKLGDAWINLDAEELEIDVSSEDIVILRIARLNNIQYKKYMENESRKYRKVLSKASDSGGVLDKIVTKGIAKYIIKAWSGFVCQNEKGETVKYPYTVENAIALLSVDEGFKNFIVEESDREGVYFDDVVKAQRKNS